MNGGLGEYFGGQGAVAPLAPSAGSALPALPAEGQWPAPPPPAPIQRSAGGTGRYFGPMAAGGLGASTWPLPRSSGAAWKVATSLSPMAGALGDTADVLRRKQVGEIGPIAATVNLGAIVIGIGLRAGAGYFVGRALAPSGRDASTYAWVGAAASVLFGSLGLGAQALYAQYGGKR